MKKRNAILFGIVGPLAIGIVTWCAVVRGRDRAPEVLSMTIAQAAPRPVPTARVLPCRERRIREFYDKETLPQVWDELRRKVGDAARGLPPGCREPFVNDDFGDGYGVIEAYE